MFGWEAPHLPSLPLKTSEIIWSFWNPYLRVCVTIDHTYWRISEVNRYIAKISQNREDINLTKYFAFSSWQAPEELNVSVVCMKIHAIKIKTHLMYKFIQAALPPSTPPDLSTAPWEQSGLFFVYYSLSFCLFVFLSPSTPPDHSTAPWEQSVLDVSLLAPSGALVFIMV